MIAGIDVTLRCDECGGSGRVLSGHPNDPFAQAINCQAGCEDGEVTHFDELTTLEDAIKDYPTAIRLQVVAPLSKWNR